jgi:succinate dehydrogenase hydrophobic anchor subunit
VREPVVQRDRVQTRVSPRGSAARLDAAGVGTGAYPYRDGRVLSFVMVRLTGLFLTVLVLGHFGLTHIVTDVAETDSSFIARRWSSAVWLTWDWLLLFMAILHGAAGVWVVIDDYTPDLARRRRRRRALVIVSALALVIGTATIVTVILRG